MTLEETVATNSIRIIDNAEQEERANPLKVAWRNRRSNINHNIEEYSKFNDTHSQHMLARYKKIRDMHNELFGYLMGCDFDGVRTLATAKKKRDNAAVQWLNANGVPDSETYQYM